MAETHLYVSMADGSTFVIERLLGTNNYTKWLQQFEVVAEQKEYSTLFSGREKLVSRPVIHAYSVAFGHRSTDHNKVDTSATIKTKSADQEALIQAEFDLDCEEYEARRQRVHKAIILLYSSIDYTLRTLIRGYDNPQLAMQALKKRFTTPEKDDQPAKERDVVPPESSDDTAATTAVKRSYDLAIRTT